MEMDERLFLRPFHYQLFQRSIVCAEPFDEHGQSVRPNVPNCLFRVVIEMRQFLSMQNLKPDT